MSTFIVLKNVKPLLDNFPSHRKNYIEQNNSFKEEQKRKGLCFVCGKAGHMQFNYPNKKRPKNIKLINSSIVTLSESILRMVIASQVREKNGFK